MFCFSVILAFLFSGAEARAAVNLQESFRAAIQRSETFAEQAELVTQAEERYSQALGAVLPNVNLVGSYLKQDAGSSAGSLSPTDQKTLKLSATQPLFRGLREYAALKQQKILRSAANHTRDSALIQLFQDTAQAFYQVMIAERDFTELQAQIGVNQKRLKDITEFKRLGRSRASEVINVQSNIASLEADIEAARTLVTTTRSIFSFLTGLDKNIPLVDQETMPSMLSPLETYTSKIEQRPDVIAAKELVEAADKEVSIAKGAHLPSLDLNGNYYFTRPGYLSDVKWDVSLGLTFPIFQGGIISSEVRIAASERKRSELSLSLLRRQSVEQIETMHAQVLGDLAQVEKQKRAADLANQNYQAELRDYRFGLVTNIEVLLALNTSQTSNRSLNRALFQSKLDYLKLLALTAERPNPKEAVP